MANNPSIFSQIGVEAVNNGYFMAGGGVGVGGMVGADVPPFHPSAYLEHAGFGFGLGDAAAVPDLGPQFAANNLMLASFASQLFSTATATAPPPQQQHDHLGVRTLPAEMAGGYGVANADSRGAASLPCPGQSGAVAVWSPSSSKKPHGGWSDADGSRTVSVHQTHHLARLPDAACFHYPLAACGGADGGRPAANELSLSLCSNSSSDSVLNATDRCSSAAGRSVLTELPQVNLRPRSRPAHFAVVVARSPYAALAQEVLNDVVGRLLDGVAEDSGSGIDNGARMSSGSVGAPSVVSSNQLMASPREHFHGGDAGLSPCGDAQRSDLIKMLQLMDQKYNQCLDEIQSTTARFNTLMQSGGAGNGNGGICTPFAHRAVSAMYHGLRRRIANEIMAAAAAPPPPSRPTCWAESSSATAGDMDRSWEAAFIQKHWAAQQLRRGEQQCWRPQRGLPEKSVAVLKAWMFENFLSPYPKDNDKDVLAARSGLSRSQVSNWFINARVRIWKPMIEEMYRDLNRSSPGGQGSAMEQQQMSEPRLCQLEGGM